MCTTFFNKALEDAQNLNKEPEFIKAFLKTYRETQNVQYNTYHKCSTEDYMDDYRQPLTLSQLCYKTLHINLCHVQKYNGYSFVDFSNSPSVIFNLKLPLSMKQELLRLILSCPRHTNLLAIVTNPYILRFKIKHDSVLFQRIERDHNQANLFKHYRFSDILQIISECLMINGQNV